MSIRVRKFIGISLVALTAGCASAGSEVRVQGTADDLQRFAGDWAGTYVGNAAHGREGTISFKLVSGDLHAHGTVMMVPGGTNEPYRRSRPEDAARFGESADETGRLLTIQFVVVDRNMVTGTLDDYWDPDRRTIASTTFSGRLRDDVIEGTFRTRYEDGETSTTGRWKVTRSRR